ncbi:PVC-type heme-binding CxxCH protein [Singulisphaera acidiphila]|uniref:Putative membrane-bound dehydrogenase n=1 Tax=Singulisphaera acidiphila (strain ATCC BAA-1392 / DSM 18658 / VKM B-2454 / MOB10) TaxID=886293 RepID=L0DLZ5_SINAD|nr:PVC-type heme-binding CxxCH protein [Singulisphaera acidiphila]AGA29845.1 putative membrane-bound dehydrogenase [Singulisphaera acidiphila DSM 18658]
MTIGLNLETAALRRWRVLNKVCRSKLNVSLALMAALLLSVAVMAQAPKEETAKPEAPTPAPEGPLSPEQGRQAFQLQPGLRVELVASEPLIASPVAMAFDERGRLYVAENRGYPTGPGEGRPAIGRIALLEDTDGDGTMDHRSEFAEGLTYPNGVLPWRGGLIVTCAPDVLYLRDTDGDGKADERRVLFTGFDTKGSTQLRVSHPTLSIDNWVYVTSGLQGGKVHAPSVPDSDSVALGRTDFRFHPDGTAGEAADGGSQFGITFDEFGRRFICYNRVQVQHVVLSSKTLRRNPHLAFSGTVQNCPAETVAEPLTGHGAAAKLFPISRNVTTADSHAGTFTAACAVTVFRGNGLPDAFRGMVFSCDPTGNLVHVDRLDPQGATFAAYPAIKGAEFLASRDNWCRPVFLASGPDGALYVCDMYRKTIEHPDYLPVEIRKRTDFEGGKGMGRIWRVVRDDLSPDTLKTRRKVHLADATTQELCATLRIQDGWRRDTAQRLLLERKDSAAVEPLRAILTDPEADPVAVVRSLHLLDAFDALSDETLRPLLKHRAAPVREHALQLVEARLAKNKGWVADVLPCADDKDARVRFQTATTLGAISAGTTPAVSTAEATAIAGALARIAARDGSDRWLRAVVFSSLSGRETPFLTALQQRPRDSASPAPELLKEFGRLLGDSQAKESWPALIRPILADQSTFSPAEQAALLTGLCEAGRGQFKDGQTGSVLDSVVGHAPDDQASEGAARKLVAAMNASALDQTRPLDQREAAVGLLAFADFAQAGETLLALIARQDSREIQVAAVRALGVQRDDRVVGALLEPSRFASFTPAVRDEVLSALISQSQHVPGLLTALESGRVSPGVIDALRRRQLTQSRDPKIRERASALFGAVAGDRAKVYDEFKDAVTLKANPAKGLVVFRRECASCHRLDREGSAVGPDLFGIRNQEKPAILLHILVPDHEITQGFAAYTVATKDGRVLTGLIASETPTSLTLRQPLGKEDTILRTEVEELAASKQSLMPQGLEKNISKQEFADLLAYLKGEGESDRPKEEPAR